MTGRADRRGLRAGPGGRDGTCLLLDNPDVSLLARVTALSGEHLDRLANALVLNGTKLSAPRVPSGWRQDVSVQS